MNDNRIGSKKEGTEPEVCAVSGELVQGRHNVQFPLDKDNYFYRVLGKRLLDNGEPPNRADLEKDLKSKIAEAVAPQGKKTEGDK